MAIQPALAAEREKGKRKSGKLASLCAGEYAIDFSAGFLPSSDFEHFEYCVSFEYVLKWLCHTRLGKKHDTDFREF